MSNINCKRRVAGTPEGKNYAQLSGWYQGMLDELISAVGSKEATLEILDARARLVKLQDIAADRTVLDA